MKETKRKIRFVQISLLMVLFTINQVFAQLGGVNRNLLLSNYR